MQPPRAAIIVAIVDILKALSNSFFDYVACLLCGGGGDELRRSATRGESPSGSAVDSDHPRMALAGRRRGRTEPCAAESRFARPSIRYRTPSRRLVSMGSLSVPRL